MTDEDAAKLLQGIEADHLAPLSPEVAERRVRWDAVMDLLSERWHLSRQQAARMLVEIAQKRGRDPIDYAEQIAAVPEDLTHSARRHPIR